MGHFSDEEMEVVMKKMQHGVPVQNQTNWLQEDPPHFNDFKKKEEIGGAPTTTAKS